MTLRPDDPPGARFYYYPGPPLPEEWSYIVDDYAIAYGPGTWPFWRRPPYSKHLEPTSVRVAPDTQFVAWGHEYVSLRPDPQFLGFVTANLNLEMRRSVTVGTRIRIDVRERTYSIDSRCPASLRPQAEAKAAKLVDLIAAAVAERDGGQARPVTAADKFRPQPQD